VRLVRQKIVPSNFATLLSGVIPPVPQMSTKQCLIKGWDNLTLPYFTNYIFYYYTEIMLVWFVYNN
jgi:hypothetical protein